MVTLSHLLNRLMRRVEITPFKVDSGDRTVGSAFSFSERLGSTKVINIEIQRRGFGMKTLLINEQFVDQFKYWREGQVRTGMRFRNDLFDHSSKFEHSHRQQAFDLAWRLGIAGKAVVVTVSPEQYIVWVRLRVTEATDMTHPVTSAVFVRSLELPIGQCLLSQPVLSA